MNAANSTLEQRLNPTILIVEDDFMIRHAVAEHLRDRGFRVMEARNATEAIDLAINGKPIDLVFSDIALGPGPDGYGLSRWFETHRPTIPVLLTSAAENCEPLPKSVRRPFVRKPCDLERIEQLLRAMLQS